MMTWIADSHSLWLTLHLFAMVLGLGGATYTDILLVRFLKDLKISHKEADVIRTMSKVVLLGIVLAFVSGLLLFLPAAKAYLEMPKFLAKVVIFVILVLNGFLLHHLILPRLVKFSFHDDHYIGKSIVSLRHLGFVMGAVSFVSWYSVFLLGSFKEVPFSLSELLGGYVLVLLVAIVVALGIEKKVRRRARS